MKPDNKLQATNNKQLLLIFTRNPELGKVKTRLASTVGDGVALDIYKFLLQHTKQVTQNLDVDKTVYYSVKVRENDIWDAAVYQKRQQHGDDLGMRMHNAFRDAFKNGYEKVVVIGSDLYDISQSDIEMAFKKLTGRDAVIGPALDGGYYLLGLTKMIPIIFKDKAWGTSTVLEDTLSDLKDKNYLLLAQRNDVDVYDDIKDNGTFQKFFKH